MDNTASNVSSNTYQYYSKTVCDHRLPCGLCLITNTKCPMIYDIINDPTCTPINPTNPNVIWTTTNTNIMNKN